MLIASNSVRPKLTIQPVNLVKKEWLTNRILRERKRNNRFSFPRDIKQVGTI